MGATSSWMLLEVCTKQGLMDGNSSHTSHKFWRTKRMRHRKNLDSDEPLGLIAQDQSLAQHVPCITNMSLGPIPRPCIDTFLCNPGTTSGHLVTSRENECTSRLQGDHEANIEKLEQEAWMPPASGRGLMMEDFKAPESGSWLTILCLIMLLNYL